MNRTRLIVITFISMLSVIIVGIATQPTEAQSSGYGWVGKFYNNTDLSGEPVVENVPYTNGLCAIWDGGQPYSGGPNCLKGEELTAVNDNNYSAIFTVSESLQRSALPSSRYWRFTLRYDDGIRFYLNGAVYDDFNPLSPLDTTGACANLCRERTFYMEMIAGRYDMRIDYVNFTGPGMIYIAWEPVAYPSVTPVTTLVTTTPASPDELIRNGGFDGEIIGDSQGDLSYWKVKNGKGDKLKCNSYPRLIARGDCLFRFKGGVGENSSLEQIIESIPEQYKGIIFDVRGRSTIIYNKLVIYITVKYSDNTEPTRYKLKRSTQTDYSEYGDQIPFASTMVDMIKVQFGYRYQHPQNKLYIDQVSVRGLEQYPVTATAPPTPTPFMFPTPVNSSADLVPLP